MAGFAATAGVTATAGAAAAVGDAETAVPHPLQNFAPASSLKPHTEQNISFPPKLRASSKTPNHCNCRH